MKHTSLQATTFRVSHWCPCGPLKERTFYLVAGPGRVGAVHGTHEEYYVHGQLKYRAHYNNGVLDGQVVRFREDGRVLSTTQYQNGVVVYELEQDTPGVVVVADFNHGIRADSAFVSLLPDMQYLNDPQDPRN